MNDHSKIPGPVATVVGEVLGSHYYNHRDLNSLFAESGASGDPPEGNCVKKVTAWLKRANDETAKEPLALLGAVLQVFMEVDQEYEPAASSQAAGRERVRRILESNGLTYQHGGRIFSGQTAVPSRTLQSILRGRNLDEVNREFERALQNVTTDPPATLTAASSILESLFKVYIEDERLAMPGEQSIGPLWKAVKDDLGWNPKSIEDDDLKRVLQGLASVVDGIGAARTHMGSAHGRGRSGYRVAPRHARLVAHAAHTLALFVIETWDEKKAKQAS